MKTANHQVRFTHSRIVPTALLCVLALAFAGAAQAAGNCKLSLKGNDAMQFDLKTATVSASCPTITIELTHTGKLPVATMGHNVVIAATKDVNALAQDGMKAGAASNYVPKGDARAIAATKVVGGGQKASTTLPGKKLKAGGDYTFFCSFPGHSAIMKGTLTVTP
jgi:azurin